jgi:hypothetical protein
MHENSPTDIHIYKIFAGSIPRSPSCNEEKEKVLGEREGITERDEEKGEKKKKGGEGRAPFLTSRSAIDYDFSACLKPSVAARHASQTVASDSFTNSSKLPHSNSFSNLSFNLHRSLALKCHRPITVCGLLDEMS